MMNFIKLICLLSVVVFLSGCKSSQETRKEKIMSQLELEKGVQLSVDKRYFSSTAKQYCGPEIYAEIAVEIKPEFIVRKKLVRYHSLADLKTGLCNNCRRIKMADGEKYAKCLGHKTLARKNKL